MLPAIVFPLICSFLSENSSTWQLLLPHLPSLGQSRNYIQQMRQGTEAMVDWSNGEDEGCVQGRRNQKPFKMRLFYSHDDLTFWAGLVEATCDVAAEAERPDWSPWRTRRLMLRCVGDETTNAQRCIHAYMSVWLFLKDLWTCEIPMHFWEEKNSVWWQSLSHTRPIPTKSI